MPKILTDAVVASVASKRGQKGWREISDGACRGLRLRIGEHGEKVWCVRHVIGGKRQRHTIGEYPAVKLAEARKRAGLYRSSARESMKPEEVDTRVRAARLTVEQAHREYVKTMKPELRESSSKRKEALFRDYIGPVIGQRLLRSIRRADVTEVVQRVRVKFPVQGNRVFSELMALLRWCEAKGYVDGIPAVRRKDIGAREKPRRRTLSEYEVGILWCAANSLTGPGADFVKLLLLSGQRRSEVRKMSWSELTLERGTWVIPASRYKTGTDHAVPLPAPALDILRARHSSGATGYVLAGRSGPAKPFNNAEWIMPRLLKLMPGCAPFTLHDIRRSVRSGMARIGIDGETAEMVLGHLPQGIRKVYDTYDRIDERKDALKRWAEYILRVTDQKNKTILSFTRPTA